MGWPTEVQRVYLGSFTLDTTLADTPKIDVRNCRFIEVSTRGTPGAITVYTYPDIGASGGVDDSDTAVFYASQTISGFTVAANQSATVDVRGTHFLKLVPTNDAVAVIIWGEA